LAEEIERTHETIYVDPDVPEPAVKRDIQMEYSSDWLYYSNTGAVRKGYL